MPEIAAEASGRYIIACNGVGIGAEHASVYSEGSTLVGRSNYVVDGAHLFGRTTNDDGSCDVGAVAAMLRAEIEQQKIVALDDASACTRVRQRGARARRDNCLERMRLAPLIAQRLLQNAGDLQLRDPGSDLLQRVRQRPRCHPRCTVNERYFVLILGFAKALHDVALWSPLPARTGRVVQEALKFAVRHVRGSETDHRAAGKLSKLRPQAIPEAGGLDAHADEVAHFFRYLRLVSEIRDENAVPRRHEQQRRRSGESRDITNVGATGYEQRIEMVFGQRVVQQRGAGTTTIRHYFRARRLRTSPRSAAS